MLFIGNNVEKKTEPVNQSKIDHLYRVLVVAYRTQNYGKLSLEGSLTDESAELRRNFIVRLLFVLRIQNIMWKKKIWKPVS